VWEAPRNGSAIAAQRFWTVGIISVVILASTAAFPGLGVGGGRTGLLDTAYGWLGELVEHPRGGRTL